MFSNHSCGWGPIIPAQVMIRFWLLETWLKVVDVKIYAHPDYCLWLAATIWYNLLKVKDLVWIPLPFYNGFQELFFRGMISFCLHYTFVRRRNMVTLIAELGSRPAQRVLQALASWTGHVRREVVIDEKRSRGPRLHQDSRFSSSSSSSTSPSASAPALYFPRTHVGGNCPVVTDGHNFPSPSPPPSPQSQPNLLPTTSNPPKDHISVIEPPFSSFWGLVYQTRSLIC